MMPLARAFHLRQKPNLRFRSRPNKFSSAFPATLACSIYYLRGRDHSIRFKLHALTFRGHSNVMVGHFRKYIVSERYSYGLRRDLTLPITTPAAKIPIFVRTLRSSDIPALLPDRAESQAASRAHIVRRQFIEMGIETAYVAATQDGIPCYVQWLIGPGENEKIQRCFGGLLPWLGPDEILLDQAFTLEPFRGLGIMPCAMSQISEIGRENGARWVLALVADDNIGAMKGCQRAGFRPYLIRRERWRLLQRGISFHLLPRGTPYPFDEVKGAAADRPLAG